MYYVRSAGNLTYKINDLLEKFFADKAEVRWVNGKVIVKVKENAGFAGEDKFLSEEDIKRGVCGGGRVDGLDGKTFCIDVTEVEG